MKIKALLACGCLAVTAGVWLAGCKPAPRPGPTLAFWGPGSYWHAGEGGKASASLPGVDQASYAMGLWQTNGSNAVPAFAVWVGTGGGGHVRFAEVPSRTRSATRRDYDLFLELADVPVEFHTADGKEGPVKIGNDSFDIANGALFLVAKHGAKLEVKQMNIAKLDVKPAGTHTLEELKTEYWRAFAKADPDIRAFWEAAAKSK
jgi:hypothetical protein